MKISGLEASETVLKMTKSPLAGMAQVEALTSQLFSVISHMVLIESIKWFQKVNSPAKSST